MAAFNPETGINDQPNDMLRYAGNASPGNKAFETLFSGLGDAVTQAAGSTDTIVQGQIKDQVQANLDQTNKLFGYDQESVPDTVGQRTNTPPELNGSAAQLSKLAAAKAQGKLTDSHYWALLQSNVKDLKAKYPGYSDQIDNIVSSVTGGTPANQLRASIAAYNARLAGAEEDQVKQVDNYLVSNAQDTARIAPDYYPGNPKYASPDARAQLYTQVSRLRARDAVYDSANKAAAFDKTQSETAQQGYKSTYGQMANSEVQTGLNSVVQAAGIGGPGSNFFEQIGKLQNNPSPQAVQQIQGALNTAKANIQSRLLQLRSGGVGMKLSPQDQESAEKAAMAPLEQLQNLITSGDYGLASRFANDNKWIQDHDLNVVLNNNPEARKLGVMSKINPALGTQYALTHGDDFMNSLQTNWFMPIQAGVSTPDELNSQLKAAGDKVTPNMRSKAVTTGVKSLVGSLANPETPDSLIKTQVSNLFRPDGSGGLQQVWADTTPDSKGALFTTLTTPSVVDRITKADPNAAKVFAQWAFNKVQELPEVRGMAGDIAGARPTTAQYVYNPNTHQFLIGAPTANGEVSPDVSANLVQGQQLKIQKFNRVLANLAYAQQKAGLDPNDVNNPGSIPALLKILGAQGQSGDIPALQKAFDAHADNAAGDTPKTEANISDTGPSFDFLTDPQTAQGFKTGENGDIKSVLRQAEAGKSEYDASIGDNGTPRAEFSKMTVSQVLQAQSSLPNSKAIGAYQFIPSTLHYAIDKAGIKLSDKFDSETQDKLAQVLMEDAGYSRWKAGKISDNDFHNNLAQIWAGLPETSGMSHYENFNGNHATVSVNDVQSALKRTKRS